MVVIKKYMNNISSRRNLVLEHTESNVHKYRELGIKGISAFTYTKKKRYERNVNTGSDQNQLYIFD